MNSFYQLNTTEEAIPYVLFYDNGNSVVPSHWHKEVELIYSLQGDTQMMINDRVFDLHEGDIGIAVGGDIHFNLCSQNHRRAVIMFNLDMFEDANSHGRIKSEIKKQLETMARISTGWPPKVRDKVVNIVEKLRVLNETGGFGRILAIKARMIDLILILCKEVPKNSSQFSMFTNINQTKMFDKLEICFAFVEQHYMSHITVEDAAAALNFAPSYFARFFKRFTNTTFLSYLNTYRINKAQWLLVNEDKSISEISEEVGFGSVKTFNRLFKATTNMSPSAYKRSLYENDVS
mgnify:FL=1